MRTNNPVLIVLGSLLALAGLACLAAGVGLAVLQTQQDEDGFLTSPTYELSSDGHAITTEELELVAGPQDWFPARGELTFRVVVTATDEGGDVFVGIADRDDADAYLDGVAHTRVVTLSDGASDVTSVDEPGTSTPGVPLAQDLWVASASGTGTQVLTVDAEPGAWTLVLMQPDAAAGVAVDAAVGVRTAALLPITIGLLAGAGVLLLAATVVLVLGAGTPRGSAATPMSTSAAPTAPAPPAAAAAPTPTHVPLSPVRLVGRLDPELSRGMWLVKWFLAIPHVVVLAFLWAALSLLTVVAGVAILFTGRYPRGIFEFNVGVLRWTWRVSHYAFGVLGTDRYPPFTLAPDPDSPAQLDVAYPEQLSRGLVLVKWWLLALPHYLVVGIFTGGLLSWTFDIGQPDGAQAVTGTGLVGVLVMVAAVVLLVRGSYPRTIHELVVGMHRWTYRVIAYAALMTDVYPPFRLDVGGEETEPAGPTSDTPQDEGGRRELIDA